ncbi:leucyl aminopeptidase family protein [Capnocytophaga cynodegmi]|uniref:leucyl aminopeptidase family protein n=1 Tax=Capnocytophaga cynodegmi TaxID=28189 RepID=UPI0037D6AC3D
MKIQSFKNINEEQPVDVTIYLTESLNSLPATLYPYLEKYFEKKKNVVISIPTSEQPLVIALFLENSEKESVTNEKARILGNEILTLLKKEDYSTVSLVSTVEEQITLTTLEGMLLGDYHFTKYKTKEEDKKEKDIQIYAEIDETKIDELVGLLETVSIARDLVNEPPSVLTTTRFSEEIQALGNHYGFDVNVLSKSQIKKLRMGGLLGVNAGSDEPPTFNILTWRPQNAKNQQPYIFVGKGVVYDTGGYNVKPGSYMDTMKSDMAGAAAVVGLLCAVAQNKLPIHVIGLIPATDNRINSNAFVSDDVLTMMNGTTVEVKNTDAEGRLILADALVYAQNLNPKIVIDLATLTGAAARVTGHYGSAFMGNASIEIKQSLQQSGEMVFERLTELPFWDEFAEDLESPIADIKNLGKPEGGASSAGKFLEHFTNYPWLHIDIAGTAFLTAPYRYFKAGATGVGIRLLYHFLKKEENI